MRQLGEDLRKAKYALSLAVILLCAEQLLWHQVCPWKLLCGLPCPGCGLTRAGWAFLTLHWKEARDMNATIFLWIGVALYGAVDRYVRKLSAGVFRGMLLTTEVATLVYYIVRMRMLYPDTEPMTFYPDHLVSFFTEAAGSLLRR